MKHLLILLLFPLFLNAQPFVQVAHTNGPVYAIAKHGNMTMIGGKFTTVNGVPAQNIAWSTDQITWNAIGSGTNDTVKDITYFNGDFFLCGTFTQANSLPNKFIVRWSPISHQFKTIPVFFNGMAYTDTTHYGGARGITNLAVADSVLYVCGQNFDISYPGGAYNLNHSLYKYTPIDTVLKIPTFWPSGNTAYSISGSNRKLYIYTKLNSNAPIIYVSDSNSALMTQVAHYCTPSTYPINAMSALRDSVYASNTLGVVYSNLTSHCMVPFDSIANYSLLSANNRLYMGGRSVYSTSGIGYSSVFTTNGTVYRMMYDTVMYFAGTFDSIGGSALGNVVKYQTPVHAQASYDSSICGGRLDTFINLSTGTNPAISWSFPGGTVGSNSTSNMQIVNYSSAGNYQALLIGSNGVSSDTSFMTVHVGTPVGLFAPSQVIFCGNRLDTIQINGLAGNQYTWSPLVGVANPLGNVFVFNSQAAPVYTINAHNGACHDSIVIHVQVGTPISLTGPSQISYCTGSADTINVSGFSGGFTWTPHTNISNAGNSFYIFAPSSVTYTIYASSGGCNDSVTVNVTVNQLPPTPIITQVDSELHSSAAIGNQWYYSGSVLNGSVSQILTPSQDGVYSVMVTDANGCRSSLSQVYTYTKPVDSLSTGIANLKDDEIVLYPNPVTTIVYLKGTFDLITSNGRMIGSYKDEADLAGLPTGIYLAVGKNFRKIIIKQ